MTGFSRATKQLILDRAAEHCECCGIGTPKQIHHRILENRMDVGRSVVGVLRAEAQVAR